MILPEAFLVTDEIVQRSLGLVKGLRICPGPTARNLREYGLFAATERVLMASVKGGGDRQELHEVIREHSLTAWQALQGGQPNPLGKLLAADARITQHIDAATVTHLLDATDHVGDATERARLLAAEIRKAINDL